MRLRALLRLVFARLRLERMRLSKLLRALRRTSSPARPQITPSSVRARAATGDFFDSSADAGGDPPEALPYGDFVDREEAERFAPLPPIGVAAVDDVDWDELARELTGPR
jgi:hypothetical protein